MSKALISVDANNITKSKSGHYYCNRIYSSNFWRRYTNTFDSITIATRCEKQKDEIYTEAERIDIDSIHVAEFPMVRGAKQSVLNYCKLRVAARDAVKGVDVVIIRLPSIIGFFVFNEAKKAKLPIAVEIVADPYDAYKTNIIARFLFTKLQRAVCRKVNGVSYVTEDYLQSKYPSFTRINGENASHFESFYSTIDLGDEYFSLPRIYNKKESYRIIHTANSINMLKGHATLIKAAKVVIDRGYNIYLTFVGDGFMRVQYEALAKQLGIDSNVEFTGIINKKEQLREKLINSDMFVLPTIAEGLSRSIIEAMAVGLPCISTNVGGNPELLDDSCLLNPDDITGFSEKIIEYIENPSLMTEQSIRNYEKAHEYSIDILSERRKAFYNQLKGIANKQ